MRRYGALLRQAIARHCPPSLAAEHDDIHQDACIRVWRTLSIGRKISFPASYIYRVAVTAAIDAIRRVKARREERLEIRSGEAAGVPEPRSTTPDPAREAEFEQLQRKVTSALSEFPADRRRAVGLHLQGFTTQEIGDLLGWSEAKARNVVYRTLKELRERLRMEGIGQ